MNAETNSKILYFFTRTPLHVGAGASVGAIDQALFKAEVEKGKLGPLALEVGVNGKTTKQVVLEEYTFTYSANWPEGLGDASTGLGYCTVRLANSNSVS